MNLYIEDSVEEVRHVDDKRNYWFIRTYGGGAYKDFYQRNYVGLGLNNVPHELIKAANTTNGIEKLRAFINQNTDYKDGEATKWARQLSEFEHDMREGDIIVIPSKNSRQLAIGVIKSPVYLVKKTGTFKFNGKPEQYPEKRRKVEWVRTKSKESFHGDLNSLMASHQGITKANRFADIIEGNISSLFIRNQHMHLVIEIGQNEDINAFALNRFLTGLTYFYQEFCEDQNIEVNEDLTIKIKLQSKGGVALKGLTYGAVFGLAGIVLLSQNPELKLELNNFKFEGKSEGFLKSYSDFLDRKQERKMEYERFTDSMNQLKAYRPLNPDSTAINTDSTQNSGK